MILELLSNPLTWTMALFVVICAWHNFRAGRLAGIAEGVDVVLEMLNRSVISLWRYQGLANL